MGRVAKRFFSSVYRCEVSRVSYRKVSREDSETLLLSLVSITLVVVVVSRRLLSLKPSFSQLSPFFSSKSHLRKPPISGSFLFALLGSSDVRLSILLYPSDATSFGEWSSTLD